MTGLHNLEMGKLLQPARPGRSTVSIPTELHLSHHNIMGSRLHFILFTKDTQIYFNISPQRI